MSKSLSREFIENVKVVRHKVYILWQGRRGRLRVGCQAIRYWVWVTLSQTCVLIVGLWLCTEYLLVYKCICILGVFKIKLLSHIISNHSASSRGMVFFMVNENAESPCRHIRDFAKYWREEKIWHYNIFLKSLKKQHSRCLKMFTNNKYSLF